LFKNLFEISPQALDLFPFKEEDNIYESKVLKRMGVQLM
jgi:hypothetical protein